MEIGELVRCPRCNSENPPEYRFCGMCGTPLDKPAEIPVRKAEPVRPSERVQQPEASTPRSQTLSGPSFLGLSEPAHGSEDVTYLFEEEQPKRTYWRFILLLLILGVVGGLGWLEYTHAGKSWTAPWANQKPTTPEQATQQQPPPPTPEPNEAAQQPAANAPANAAAPAQNAPGTSPQTKEADGTPSATPAPGTTASQPPAAAPAAAAAQSEQPPPAAASTQKSEATPSGSQVAKNEAPANKGDDDGGNAAADTTEEAPPAKPKPARVKPAPVPATNPDDALVANAEKYLYGRGVPQNCDRALVSLRAAADRQNSRAQTLLGTMYGTGHCVPRDLPNAYRWFASASRQQSDNMWIQRNLEMIWREMTPQERQLAMQSNR